MSFTLHEIEYFITVEAYSAFNLSSLSLVPSDHYSTSLALQLVFGHH